MKKTKIKNVLLTTTFIAITLASCIKDSNNRTVYHVNEDASVIEWKGYAPDHYHNGSFKVRGQIKTEVSGKITSADFTIPISSIDEFNLEEDLKQQLLNHLKSSDFFNIAIHPNAKFHFTKSEAYNGNDAEAVDGANWRITGDFTMIGQTHPITFPAKITYVNDSLKVEAILKIDRTKWGMLTDSDPQNTQYILPDVSLKLDLASGKKD